MSLTVFALATIVSVAEVLVVETGTPDALCPNLSEVTRAIHARVGTIKTEHRFWRARYTVGHAPGSDEGDFIRLELFDPGQRVRLSRDLPMRGESCATVAQKLAIVLSGYFTSLSSLADDAAPEESRVPQSVEDGTVAPSAGLEWGNSESQGAPPLRTKNESFPDAARASGTRPTEHRAGLGAYVPFASGSRGIAVSYSAIPVSHREIGLQLAWPLERIRQDIYGGSVSLISYRARFWYGLTTAKGRFSMSAGPSLLLGLDVAKSQGLDENRQRERFLGALGLLADATLWVDSWFGVGIQSGIDLTSRVLTKRFQVEAENPDSDREVYAPRPLNGFVTLSFRASLSE